MAELLKREGGCTTLQGRKLHEIPLFLLFYITLFANTTMASRRTWKTVWLRCEPEYTGGTPPYQVRCPGIYRHHFAPYRIVQLSDRWWEGRVCGPFLLDPSPFATRFSFQYNAGRSNDGMIHGSPSEVRPIHDIHELSRYPHCQTCV